VKVGLPDSRLQRIAEIEAFAKQNCNTFIISINNVSPLKFFDSVLLLIAPASFLDNFGLQVHHYVLIIERNGEIALGSMQTFNVPAGINIGAYGVELQHFLAVMKSLASLGALFYLVKLYLH